VPRHDSTLAIAETGDMVALVVPEVSLFLTLSPADCRRLARDLVIAADSVDIQIALQRGRQQHGNS
jgi:hypothetical protein